MWEVRMRVRELMSESAYTHQALADEISRRYGYRVHGSEWSRYVSGELDTPKARKALTDGLEVLLGEKRRRDALLKG